MTVGLCARDQPHAWRGKRGGPASFPRTWCPRQSNTWVWRWGWIGPAERRQWAVVTHLLVTWWLHLSEVEPQLKTNSYIFVHHLPALRGQWAAVGHGQIRHGVRQDGLARKPWCLRPRNLVAVDGTQKIHTLTHIHFKQLGGFDMTGNRLYYEIYNKDCEIGFFTIPLVHRCASPLAFLLIESNC